MDKWAARFGTRAAFVCVGCAGAKLAEAFGSELKLARCHNTYIADMRRSGPRWGQLGCNGLIVLDAGGKVVCAKSKAFMQERGAAFAQVEALLLELLGDEGAAEDAGEQQQQQQQHQQRQAKRARHCGDNSPGGCAEGCERCDSGEKLELAPIASVSVPELDEEHEQCAAALEQLAAQRSSAALEAVLEAYEAHFAHEEALLDEHLYGGAPPSEAPAGQQQAAAAGAAPAAAGLPGGSFSADASARKSHWTDHARLLQDVRELLREARGGSDDDVADGGRVPVDAVQRVMRDFEQHAARYDNAYAERLSAQLRLAGAGGDDCRSGG